MSGHPQADGDQRPLPLLLPAPLVSSGGGLPGHLLKLPGLRRGPGVAQPDASAHDRGGKLLLVRGQ